MYNGLSIKRKEGFAVAWNDLSRIAVCDDDPSDRGTVLQLLQEYLDRQELSIRIDTFCDGESFLASDLNLYDLVILDIYMGELSGIETARRLCEAHPNMQIIFCSSSNAYAAESYEVSALRYLTKPLQREKFNAALDRFFRLRSAMRTLTFKANRMDEQVYLDRVLWIETRDHKCILHTLDGDFETRTTFQQLLSQLEGADFVKPIRYALVSLQAVTAIPSDVFTLKNGDTIPISRDQRAKMRAAFTDFKMKQLLSKGGALT